MMNLKKAIKILLDHRKELQRLFKISRLGIFGSYARGEQKKRSDIDILVEFRKPICLIQFSSLQNYISDLLGIKVDLVSKKALRSSLKGLILKETIYI